MTKKKLFVLAGLGLLAFSLGGFMLLRQDNPKLRWRRELVQFKLAGVLPGEGWARIVRRVGPSSIKFEGMQLDAARVSRSAKASGERLFQQRCSICHGKDGKGGGEGGHIPVDFTRGDFQTSLSDLDIYLTLTRGIPGTNMPPASVSVTQGLELATFIRSLGSAKCNPSAACDPKEVTARSPINYRASKDIFVSSKDVTDGLLHRGDWLSYPGDYTGRRFSALKQIDKTNVSKMRPRFVFQTRSLVGLESTPLVANGVMFLTGSENQVIALDLATGAPFWEHERPIPAGVSVCCGRYNRGVALLGDRVYYATLDAHLVALNTRDGKEIWDTQVADFRQGYSMTGAPLAIGNKIIVGMAGGDFGVRGFVDAYDPETGKRLWRFDTIPSPGQAGHETWKNDAWKTGGGATWNTGTYDPELHLLYWGVGNPGPDFNPQSRPGDNLYTSSVVALDESTGALRWHYQFTPNDGNDWDSTQVPVLVDADYKGHSRKLMLFANRNCFFYVLDRETGEFLQATSYCEQNWNNGFTAQGRPIRRSGSITSEQGSDILPGVLGGANWMPPAYNPSTALFYVKNYERHYRVVSEKPEYLGGRLFFGGRVEETRNQPIRTALTAIRRTGEVAWRNLDNVPELNKSGVLTTATGLVFTGDSQKRLLVLDAGNGNEIWHFLLGGEMAMAPITYQYEGSQELAVISGGSVFVMSLVR